MKWGPCGDFSSWNQESQPKNSATFISFWTRFIKAFLLKIMMYKETGQKNSTFFPNCRTQNFWLFFADFLSRGLYSSLLNQKTVYKKGPFYKKNQSWTKTLGQRATMQLTINHTQLIKINCQKNESAHFSSQKLPFSRWNHFFL